MKTLIEIHALQNFAPSNLNRDDTGAPKDAIFGGSRRARISSQCLKRALRQRFMSSLNDVGLISEDLAVRTKRVLGAIVDVLVAKGRAESEANEKVRLALGAMKLVVKDDGKTEYLLFLGKREIIKIAELINDKWDALKALKVDTNTGEKKSAKGKKQAAQSIDPVLKKALDTIFDGGKALDIALFGRMLADMPEKNQDAACQVAHAISTNSIEREFDFYTAVDDLKPDDTAGADMMGTVEFNSACFYRYAVIDWDKLLENLQGDSELAIDGLKGFMEGFVLAEPSGKQNSFAAHNPPEFVSVSIRHDSAPRSLANAFETAIRVHGDESLTKRSAEDFVRKEKDLQSAYEGTGTTYILNIIKADVGGMGTEVKTLKELIERSVSAVRE